MVFHSIEVKTMDDLAARMNDYAKGGGKVTINAISREIKCPDATHDHTFCNTPNIYRVILEVV